MNLKKIKAVIESVDDFVVLVTTDKKKYYFEPDVFNPSDLIEPSQKLELLISSADEHDDHPALVSYKILKKPKPLKFANFSTLLSHMNKTLDRLQETKSQLPENASSQLLDEQIEYLKKGLDIFS